MLKPTMLAIAEYANTGQRDKLNVIGVFDILYSESFPIQYHQLYLVARFLADADEFETDHDIEFILTTTDTPAEELIRVPAKAHIGTPSQGKYTAFDSILELRNITFKQPGIYAFDVLVDGNSVGNIPITALEGKAPGE